MNNRQISIIEWLEVKKNLPNWLEGYFSRILINKNCTLCQSFSSWLIDNNFTKEEDISNSLLKISKMLKADAEFIYSNDPAAQSIEEVMLSYPGFLGIALYRLAHLFYKFEIPILPRMITEYAHSKTGIDIHPGAEIASPFYIDHGTGIVIGQTTKIGERVKIYQGVTLGALAVSKSENQKRHPTIQNDVVLYAGCCILGGNTTIGHHSVVGGNAWVVESVPAYSLIVQKSNIEILDKQKTNEIINFVI